MNRKQIVALINSAHKMASATFGESTVIYRAKNKTNPITSSNKRGTALVNVAPKDGGPRKFDEVILNASFDRAAVKKSDYLVNSTGTYFVQERADLQGSAVVLCNNVVTITRDGGNYVAVADTVLVQDWPCGWHRASAGSLTPSGVPGSTSQPLFNVYLPHTDLIAPIQVSDILTDAAGERYTIKSAEYSDLGWRLTVVSGNV